MHATVGIGINSPRFDFADLWLFVCVARSASLTLAAERACLSLPAASMRIKQLETAVGATLLYRRQRGTSLTAAGECFLKHAEHLLRYAEEATADMAHFADGRRGHVIIWANTTAFRDFLPSDLVGFLADHPEIDVELRERPSAEIIRALRDGTIEIGIVSEAADTDGLEALPYKVDELVMAVPGNHPLAARKTVRFSECLVYDFVGLASASALQTYVQAAAVSTGRPLRLRIEVASFDDLAHLVGAGIGIAVFPISIARRLGDAIRVLQLDDPWSITALRICRNGSRNISGAANRLVAYLQSRSSLPGGGKLKMAGERKKSI
ncbi:LysR family transcriptional regulator [Bordetella genomosp. 10]|uniref:LysR family transcriptional regulator n=1 Tax=Bordetella genomosp. 10 TaxID=1416804 RepID=UPI0015C5FB80|nr:LysR family transcriptional regulator [Bordetella genomosp. 10]